MGYRDVEQFVLFERRVRIGFIEKMTFEQRRGKGELVTWWRNSLPLWLVSTEAPRKVGARCVEKLVRVTSVVEVEWSVGESGRKGDLRCFFKKRPDYKTLLAMVRAQAFFSEWDGQALQSFEQKSDMIWLLSGRNALAAKLKTGYVCVSMYKYPQCLDKYIEHAKYTISSIFLSSQGPKVGF